MLGLFPKLTLGSQPTNQNFPHFNQPIIATNSKIIQRDFPLPIKPQKIPKHKPKNGITFPLNTKKTFPMALLVPSPEISGVFSNPNPNRNGFRFPMNNYKFGSKSVRVCSGIKDSAVRTSELDRNLRPYGQFSAPVKQGPKPSKEDQEKQEYYVNMGYAIRTLREELPELFFRELSLNIYRDDITFKDPINTFTGIENYKSIFSALRFHGQIFFKALWVDVISVSQPMDNVIMVRWAIHGMPRVPWESRGRFDGTSEYKLDKKGKIYEHRVDNIALNSPPKFQMLGVGDIMQSLGCPSTPKATFFETSSLPSSKRT